ncbi:hypothetical protein, partial [Salinispora arenicola]|uniref:hypothetical protein n=1 Tax=Salinispora arenicola TaxID=168697 RepID=UPI00169190F7
MTDDIVRELAAALDAAYRERVRLEDELDIATAAYERRTRQLGRARRGRQLGQWRGLSQRLSAGLRQAHAARDQAISTSQRL